MEVTIMGYIGTAIKDPFLHALTTQEYIDRSLLDVVATCSE